VTITELIEQLESLKAKHGDVACVIRDSDFKRRSVREIKHLESRDTPWRARPEPFIQIAS
jgi:hypothetical protein